MSHKIQQIKHHYPENVCILDDYYLSSIAGRLSQSDLRQPQFNFYLKEFYKYFFIRVLNHVWPVKEKDIATRMSQIHPEQKAKTHFFDPAFSAVCVDLARAGMVPSQVVFDQLNHLVSPERVRQDHVFASRVADQNQRVTHTELSSNKIGGTVENAFVFIPDPMGATGHSLSEVISHYKNSIEGKSHCFISLHMIITPEFVRKISQDHPDTRIFAARLDRGFSTPEALNEAPGKLWEQEKGLNDSQYIVPGAGGVGELINNSFV